MTTFEEKVKEILNEPFSDGWVNTIDNKTQAILKAVEEMVPEENFKYGIRDGWQACRNQFLLNLRGEKP